MKLRAAALVAAMVVLVTAGCTDTDEPTDAGTSSPSAPGASAPSSMTFEEAYRTLPMDGTKDLPISWDLSKMPDSDEVLAARRSLAFFYWERSSTDWTPIIPIGRFLFTEKYYQEVLAPFLNATDTGNPSIGSLWVKIMGVEKTGSDQALVTFCTDHGYWHRAADKSQVRKDRATIESYVMHHVQTGDGERRWLADQHFANDGDRQAKYGTECTKWAQHQP